MTSYWQISFIAVTFCSVVSFSLSLSLFRTHSMFGKHFTAFLLNTMITRDNVLSLDLTRTQSSVVAMAAGERNGDLCVNAPESFFFNCCLSQKNEHASLRSRIPHTFLEVYGTDAFDERRPTRWTTQDLLEWFWHFGVQNDGNDAAVRCFVS